MVFESFACKMTDAYQACVRFMLCVCCLRATCTCVHLLLIPSPSLMAVCECDSIMYSNINNIHNMRIGCGATYVIVKFVCLKAAVSLRLFRQNKYTLNCVHVNVFVCEWEKRNHFRPDSITFTFINFQAKWRQDARRQCHVCVRMRYKHLYAEVHACALLF